MANKSGVVEKDLRVTFQSIDPTQRTIAVVRRAPGRNGHTRHMNLILRFSEEETFCRLLDSYNEGRISAGDEVLLRLRQRWDESHSGTSVIDFDLSAGVDAIHLREVAARAR